MFLSDTIKSKEKYVEKREPVLSIINKYINWNKIERRTGIKEKRKKKKEKRRRIEKHPRCTSGSMATNTKDKIKTVMLREKIRKVRDT